MSDQDNVDLDSLNYVVKAPYNGTGPTGGDPLTENMNIWYEVSDGHQFHYMRDVTSGSCNNELN